jgi:hypothetical protein
MKKLLLLICLADLRVISLVAMQQYMVSPAALTRVVPADMALAGVNTTPPVSCCERHFRCSLCCTRMYEASRGRCDWTYPCCFCYEDNPTGIDHGFALCLGENPLVCCCLSDCALRHCPCVDVSALMDAMLRMRRVHTRARINFWGCTLALTAVMILWAGGWIQVTFSG